MGQASCFTFVRGMSATDVVENAGLDGVRDLDLTDTPDAASEFQGEGIAIFDAGDGWTLLYQDNGYPEQYANSLAASPAVTEAVVVFWNVNSVTEFSYWRAGTQLVRFEFPDDIDGSEPGLLAEEMRAVGLTMANYESDTESYYPRMMALAEHITGVHLGPDFLQRRVLMSHAPEPQLDEEGGFMG